MSQAPPLQLPPSLTNSSDASEALRNLLDSVSTSPRSSKSPPTRLKDPEHGTRSAARDPSKAALHGSYSHGFGRQPSTTSLKNTGSGPSSTLSSPEVRRRHQQPDSNGHVPPRTVSTPLQQDQGRHFPRHTSGISTDSGEEPWLQQQQHQQPRAPGHGQQTPGRRHSHKPNQHAWEPAANSTPLRTPSRSVGTQVHPQKADVPSTPNFVPNGASAPRTHSHSVATQTPKKEPVVEQYLSRSTQTPQKQPHVEQYLSRSTQTPREKSVSWGGVPEYDEHSQHRHSPLVTQPLNYHAVHQVADASAQTLPSSHTTMVADPYAQPLYTVPVVAPAPAPVAPVYGQTSVPVSHQYAQSPSPYSFQHQAPPYRSVPDVLLLSM